MSTKVKTGIEHALGVPHIEDLEKAIDLDTAHSLNTTDLANFIKNLPTKKEDEHDEEDSLYTMDDDEEEDSNEQPDLEALKKSMQELKDMRLLLRDIPNLAARKKVLEKLADRAEKHFEDVMDMAFDAEEKYSAAIINAATNLLQAAIGAHAKVLESDVKLVDLQIKKDKTEIELNIKSQGIKKPDEIPVPQDDGEERVPYNRNDLIK